MYYADLKPFLKDLSLYEEPFLEKMNFACGIEMEQ